MCCECDSRLQAREQKAIAEMRYGLIAFSVICANIVAIVALLLYFSKG